jgi:hypothetical protein
MPPYLSTISKYGLKYEIDNMNNTLNLEVMGKGRKLKTGEIISMYIFDLADPGMGVLLRLWVFRVMFLHANLSMLIQHILHK